MLPTREAAANFAEGLKTRFSFKCDSMLAGLAWAVDSEVAGVAGVDMEKNPGEVEGTKNVCDQRDVSKNNLSGQLKAKRKFACEKHTFPCVYAFVTHDFFPPQL